MNRQTTTLLKGLGILLIVCHNFTHWLPLCVAENEYTFCLERINLLAQYLGQGGPHVILNIFSHFGHYGVAIFLFVSGYGLTKKYEATSSSLPDLRPQQLGVGQFLLDHAFKLWKLMLPALICYIVIEQSLGSWNRPWSRLLPLVGFYCNLQPTRDLILGPWWWFSLMMQLYVVWRLLIYRRSKVMLYSLMGFCLALEIGVAWLERGDLDSLHTLTCYLHYNFPCSMLAFGLGVAHARYNLRWLVSNWAAPVGLGLIIIGSLNAGIWCISPMGAIMVSLLLTRSKKEKKDTTPSNIHYINIKSILTFLGSISAWLFALHPIVRAYAIKLTLFQEVWWTYLALAIYIVASVVAAWLFHQAWSKKLFILHNKKQKL